MQLTTADFFIFPLPKLHTYCQYELLCQVKFIVEKKCDVSSATELRLLSVLSFCAFLQVLSLYSIYKNIHYGVLAARNCQQTLTNAIKNINT